MNRDTLAPQNQYFQNDESFNALYPYSVKSISTRHWTPLHIIKCAVEFLDTKAGCKVLDIGSGTGKFCLAGALYAPRVNFFGIEQRGYLVKHARTAQKMLALDNVTFYEGNFTGFNLRQFDHFYFFNSFYENLNDTDKIDDTIDYSEALYEYYVHYLRNELAYMPKGTKIVTFHSLLEEIPRGYHLVDTLEGGDLSFWIKT